MKTILGIIFSVWLVGCIAMQETASEHMEGLALSKRISSDPRIVEMLATKPDKDIGVLGDSRGLVILVNDDRTVGIVDNRAVSRLGNRYTAVELEIIANVAFELKREMKIQRKLYILDCSVDKSREVIEDKGSGNTDGVID